MGNNNNLQQSNDEIIAALKAELAAKDARLAKVDSTLSAYVHIGEDRKGKEYEVMRLRGGFFAKGSGAPSHGKNVWANLYEDSVIAVVRHNLQPEVYAELLAQARIVKDKADTEAKAAKAAEAKAKNDELAKAKAEAKAS